MEEFSAFKDKYGFLSSALEIEENRILPESVWISLDRNNINFLNKILEFSDLNKYKLVICMMADRRHDHEINPVILKSQGAFGKYALHQLNKDRVKRIKVDDFYFDFAVLSFLNLKECADAVGLMFQLPGFLLLLNSEDINSQLDSIERKINKYRTKIEIINKIIGSYIIGIKVSDHDGMGYVSFVDTEPPSPVLEKLYQENRNDSGIFQRLKSYGVWLPSSYEADVNESQ